MSSVFPPKLQRCRKDSNQPRIQPEEKSHEKWSKTVNGQRYGVTVDQYEEPFDAFLVSSMSKQAGVSKKEFYNARS